MSEIEVSYSKLPKIQFHRTKKWFLVTFGIEQKGPMGQHMPEKGALFSQFQSFGGTFWSQNQRNQYLFGNGLKRKYIYQTESTLSHLWVSKTIF